MFAGDHIQHAHGFSDHFRSDAVAGEEGNVEIQCIFPFRRDTAALYPYKLFPFQPHISFQRNTDRCKDVAFQIRLHQFIRKRMRGK